MAPNESYIEIAHRRAAEKKTHVSFPQIKYPSLRDGGLRDPLQWLDGKALDDGAEGLWRVHDGLYDLNDFMKRHPGGEEWLELSKGTDITEAFESHHMNPTIWKSLEKFYVRDAKTPRNSPFTFEDDGFYRTLKRAAVEEIKKIPPNAARHADMFIDGMFITLLVCSALSCWAKNYWVVMTSYMIASLALTFVCSAGHNYIHRKTNWRMYLFNLSMWSYRDFRVTHVLSHHLFPNTLWDIEISAFEPMVIWNPRKLPFVSKLAFLSEQLVFPFIYFINFGKRVALIFKRDGFFAEHIFWHDGIGFLLPIWMWLVSGDTFANVLYNWLWILCTSSYFFFTIAANAAHHHPDIFKDGDQVVTPTLDWGMHELEAVMDRTDVNGNAFTIMCFFGYHSLHHLFPTIDHTVLHYLYPLVVEHCEKFKANFRFTSSLDLFIGQIKQTLKTDPNVVKN